MTPLEASEISARRRPFVVLAIASARLASGFLLAFPLASVVASSGIGLRDEGDRALFEGGGYLLLELLRVQGAALSAAARGLLPLLALGLIVTCACNVALLVALNVREPLKPGVWLGRSAALLPAQLVVAAGAALTKVALGVFGAMAIGAVPQWLAKPVHTSVAQIAAFAPFLLLCGAVGGFEDLVKATLVRHPAPLGDGVARAWASTKKRPFLSWFGWVPYAALFVIALAAAAKLVEAIDVSRPGTWRVVAVFAVHQLVIVLGLGCRALWFAKALAHSASSEA